MEMVGRLLLLAAVLLFFGCDIVAGMHPLPARLCTCNCTRVVPSLQAASYNDLMAGMRCSTDTTLYVLYGNRVNKLVI